MRPPSDLPRPTPGGRSRGRIALIALGAIFFLVVVFGRGVAGFYLDYLWHDGLGRTDVFWGQLLPKLTLFGIFFGFFVLLALVNLWLSDRFAPSVFPANVHPYVERFHQVFGRRLRLVRYGTAVFLGLMLSLPATQQWQDWLLFRNSRDFGVDDPQFGADVGFYVFQLPFLSFALDWLYAAAIVVLLLTLLAHLLNGGVMITGNVPTIRRATKVHAAALLAVLALLKAGDYWLSRFALTNETRGFVQGATYTVVNAQLPALMLLTLIAVLTGLLYLTAIRTDRWRLPLLASALWLVVSIVGGVIYPSVVQSLVVRPNQEEREAPYIERNVVATRAAMGLDAVETREIEFSSLTTAEVEGDLEPIENVRLLTPGLLLSRFAIDRGEVAGLQIDDLDIDRYLVDGELEQVLVAARELDLAGIPNNSWQGQHLVSTRGCGLVMAPVSRVTTSLRPDYRTLEVDRPELYFSPALTGYAVANTDVMESQCGDGSAYSGRAGIEMRSAVRRAITALAFLDYNILGSGAINSDSQLLLVRDVQERVEKLAPFLDYDGDPYPVAVDGRVVWVIDAYTATSNYPYAQSIGNVQLSRSTGLDRSANYVRNSVKAVVDAYTGEATFYVVDDADPILDAWSGAFPDLFTPLAEMPAELREHLRYPEDLFRVQTDLYSKYQIAPEDFFQRTGAWSVAQAPSIQPRGTVVSSVSGGLGTGDEFALETNSERFVPYYTLFRDRDSGEQQFVILRPFVPFSTDDRRTELQAYMTASSDPDSYGRLITYVVDQESLPSGPLRVATQAESEQLISREISFQDNEESGTDVLFGDMQILPVADGLIYVRPFYVSIDGVTEYRFVIVSHDNRATFASSLREALSDLFPGFDADLPERVIAEEDLVDGEPAEPVTAGDAESDSGATDSGADQPTEGGLEVPATPDERATTAELLLQAEALFALADEQLRAGDLGAYQATIQQAEEFIRAALATLD